MYVCACTRRHAKVIVSARSPLYMMGGYVTKGVGRRLLYKVLEQRLRSQCIVVNGRERLYACHVVMCR